VAELRREFPAEEVERHLAMLPERYLRTTDTSRMVRHFLLLGARDQARVAFHWSDLPDGQWTELTVIAPDRPGLFAVLAGTLTAANIDILRVDLCSREDGVVIDTFWVREQAGHGPVDEVRRARLEAALREAVAGRVDVGRAVEKWRGRLRGRRRTWGRAAKAPSVKFDQEASALATVVEVKAPDQPGLAYTIADTLAGLGLDITFARVATAKALALDVFYVRDAQGRKLAPEVMAEVEESLLRALGDRSRANRVKEA
jgi:[protein-PII] uridylyltransferase